MNPSKCSDQFPLLFPKAKRFSKFLSRNPAVLRLEKHEKFTESLEKYHSSHPFVRDILCTVYLCNARYVIFIYGCYKFSTGCYIDLQVVTFILFLHHGLN